jgi:hypothetical protein
MAKAYLSQMGLTVATKCLSEQITVLKPLSYQLVTAGLRLIAEVLGLGLVQLWPCKGRRISTLGEDHEAREQ